MTEQEHYEAGLQAWQDCLPTVLGRIPDGDNNASAFIAGFLEAVLGAMLAAYDREHVTDMVRIALGNAVNAHEEHPLNPADWREQ